MTTPTNSSDRGNDQAPHDFGYGHGRMPFFMKLVWLGFLAFATLDPVQFLLTAAHAEITTGG